MVVVKTNDQTMALQGEHSSGNTFPFLNHMLEIYIYFSNHEIKIIHIYIYIYIYMEIFISIYLQYSYVLLSDLQYWRPPPEGALL